MTDQLDRIEAKLDQLLKQTKPKAKRKKALVSDRDLVEQGRAACVPEDRVQTITDLWQQACPDHRQPQKISDTRRLSLLNFWNRFEGNADEMLGVFETVAASDYLSRPPKNWLDLFWACKPDNTDDILGGKYDNEKRR